MSEIRQSTVTALLEKVRRHNYGKYLLQARLEHVRAFRGPTVTFEFPVTALIGPNGGGKSTVLGAAACAYRDIRPGIFFPKSAIGDDSMADWVIEYAAIDKSINPEADIRRGCRFRQMRWKRNDVLMRPILYFSIERTVPAGEKPCFKKLMRSTYQHTGVQRDLDVTVAEQVEKILGKSVSQFHVTDIGTSDSFHIGGDGTVEYSEFHFGAGESSVIRMVSAIETTAENALILVEEIENGLHPVAIRRLVEYFVDVAQRRSSQVIFTTHSDYALDPLPAQAIWAAIDGTVQQGKLSVETLRAVSGRIDTKVVVFVEDNFAKCWLDCILRERLRRNFDQVEVYAVSGNGNAKRIHNGHRDNPAIQSVSFCYLDGDSQQIEDIARSVYRMPGSQPEATVVENVCQHLDDDLAILTVSCQRPPEAQEIVREAVNRVRSTNRDPHLLFNQIGIEIGFVSEIIVRGAFLAIWMRRNGAIVDALIAPICEAIEDAEQEDAGEA
ncbi:MAG: ATP-binding protein [Candidatus Erginobacter occultus]|nr:ATP-binding protein [Candidatus Erginobacter occultus]